MKAFRITEPSHTELTEVEQPVAGKGEVLLHIRNVGFCGSDLSTFRGMNPLVTYPRIPGHEIGALIDEVGPGVPQNWKVGMPVLVSPYSHCGSCTACRQRRFHCCQYNQTMGVQRDGAMTEYVVVPHEKLFTTEILSLEEMALVEPLTVGFHAVDRGRVTATDTVLVFGVGAIGIGAIAGAAARGAEVIAVDVDTRKLTLATQVGATLTINSAAEHLHERLVEMTGGDGPEVVIEAVGLPQTFRSAVEEVCFAGRVVYIGYAKTPVEYETKLFVMKELDILGSRNAAPKDFEAVIAMLEKKTFPVDEVLTTRVSLEEAGAALAAWAENPGSVTKLQLVMP